MGAEQALIFKHAAPTCCGIAKAIEDVSSLPPLPTGMSPSFFSGSTMVDDNKLRRQMDAQQDLVPDWVIGNRIDVQPVLIPSFARPHHHLQAGWLLMAGPVFIQKRLVALSILPTSGAEVDVEEFRMISNPPKTG